jgi:hypothetical protein
MSHESHKLLLDFGSADRDLPGFVRVGRGPGAAVRWAPGERLPLATGSVDGIHCRHLLGRLDPGQATAFLRECRRALSPEGALRVVTTDLDRMIRAYLGDWRKQPWLQDPANQWIRHRGSMLNTFMRGDGRRWAYTEEELVEMAGWAGFSAVRRRLPGCSGVPHFRGLETRADLDVIFEFFAPRRARPAEPLVSVLIPAYGPAFFEAALHSAQRQTWRRLEILVCDDSPGDDIRGITAAAAAADPRVRYLRNEPPRGAYENYVHCFRQAAGDYVKFLNDDDLLHPECVERMARVLSARPGVTLVTSHRQRVDAAGQDLPDIDATERPVSEDSVLDGPECAGWLITRFRNFVGEPSTAMFRREDLEDARPHALSFAGRPVHWNVDVAMWLHLLGKGDLVYLRDSLSSFRQHDSQQSWAPEGDEKSVAAWRQMSEDAARLGYPKLEEWAQVLVRPLGSVPAVPATGLGLGRALHGGGLELHAAQRFEAAAETFQCACEAEPGLAVAHLHLGLTLYALGRFPEAAGALDRALELDPRVPAPIHELRQDLHRRLEAETAPAMH